MRNYYKKPLLLSLFATLAACGGGGWSQSTPAVTIADCFQFTNGNEYTKTNIPNITSYIDSSGTSTSNYTRSSTNYKIQADTYNGKTVQALKGIASFTITGANSTTINSSSRSFTDFYETTVSTRTLLGGNDTTTYPNVQTTYANIYTSTGSIDLGLTVGQSSTTTFVRKDTNSNNSNLITSTTAETITFVGLEDVITSAGTFKNACKINYTNKYTSDSQNATTINGSGTRWAAKGFGTVKAISTSQFNDGRMPSAVTFTMDTTAVTKGAF